MTKKAHLLAAALTVLMTTACSEAKKDNNIIIHKKAAVAKKKTLTMGDFSQNRNIEWLGSTYTIYISRKADPSLGTACDESGNKYYDNRIVLRITRKDGTVFLDHTYTKSDFARYVDKGYQSGALLGIVYDREEDGYLYFAASIGSPDSMSDEYVPLVLRINRNGGIDVYKDTQMDTGSDASSTELEQAEEDGV